MFCNRCDTEFEEGLRYCKWCGQPLSKASRQTGELLRCAACGDAVRDTWAFCKSCGGRLAAAPDQLSVTECAQCGALVESSQGTCSACGSLLAPSKAHGAGHCQWCGELLESNSVYCKACGRRVVQPSTSEPVSPVPVHSSEEATAHLVRGVETTVLADPEQPTPTSVLGRPRITGALEMDGFDSEPAAPRIEEPSPTDVPAEESGFGFVETAPSQTAGGEVGQTPLPPPTLVQPEPSNLAPEPEALREDVETRWLSEPMTTESSQAEMSKPPTESAGKPPTGAPAANVQPPLVQSAAESRGERPSHDGRRGSRLEGSGAQELQKWDSKVRSLSGSPGAQPADSSPIQARPARIERSAPQVNAAPLFRASHSNVGLFVSAAVLVVLVGAALVVWRFALVDVISRPENGEAANEISQPAPPSPTAPQPAPPSPTAPPDGMVFVDGGLYDIGRDDGDPYARPRRTVTLAPFFIDRTEVTNAQYKRFVDATGHAAPEGWSGGNYPAGTGDLPVINVSWQEATDYARWMGKRLPTEAEWEAAARGKDGRVYPWGNRWRSDVANVGTAGIVEVGKFQEGASPFGALDMIGNVWEWTADEFHLYPGNNVALPSGMKLGVTYRVIRGGADNSEIHDASYRGFLDDGKGYPRVGFRTVKNADQ